MAREILLSFSSESSNAIEARLGKPASAAGYEPRFRLGRKDLNQSMVLRRPIWTAVRRLCSVVRLECSGPVRWLDSLALSLSDFLSTTGLDFEPKARIAICDRLTTFWSQMARLAICGALGGASVDCDAANHWSLPHDQHCI